jgi:pimeloyl-ACP methyl ester carboxylesterase
MITAVVLTAALSSAAPLTPCTLAHPAGVRAYARCGSVDVAVDAAHPEGKQVGIGFAVLPATGADPKGLPIAFLAGGPGQAATRDYVALLPLVPELRVDHAVVLVDIRGTGRSEPQECAAEQAKPLAERIKDDADIAAAAACARAMTLDPRFITTRDAARDVDAVRAALGFDSWHVLGVSYGTRLAVIYDQLFPGRARSLILDGTAPLDRALAEDVPADMTAALRAAGDDVVAAFVALKERLEAAPTTVKLRHPTTGQPMELPVDARLINATVRMLVYTDETRALLGPVLRQGLDGDLQPLVSLAVTVAESLEGAIHGPVNASILCAEDVPYFSDEPPPKDAVFDDERPTMRALCERWPHAIAPQPKMQPTSTPTLILSGELDPITPPRHARRIEAGFADHAHVVVNGVGHGVLAKGCVADVVVDFLDAGTAKGLDFACVKKIKAFPAFIDPMGPPP